MAGENSKPGSSHAENKYLESLFGDAISSFCYSNFNDSDENRIFREVFSIRNGCSTNPNTFFQINMPGQSEEEQGDAEGRVLHERSQHSQSDSLEENAEQGNPSSGKMTTRDLKPGKLDQKSSLCGEKCNRDSRVKRPKLSPDEWWFDGAAKGKGSLSIKDSTEPDTSQLVLALCAPCNERSLKMACQIVESCGQGITSTYYVPPRAGSINSTSNSDDDMTPRSRNGKTVEVGTPRKSRALVCLESKPVDEISESTDLVLDLYACLRMHAHNLIIDAGFEVEKHKRTGRIKEYINYKRPKDGMIIRSLSKAWTECGRKLFNRRRGDMARSKGREWVSVDVFRKDLSETLAYAGKPTRRCLSSLSIEKRWELLDPFMTVVCIDHKVSALKEGNRIKVVHGKTLVISAKERTVLARKNEERVVRPRVVECSSFEQICSPSDVHHPVDELPSEHNSSSTEVGSSSHGALAFGVSTIAVVNPPLIEEASVHMMDGGEFSPVSCLMGLSHFKGSCHVAGKRNFSRELHKLSAKSMARRTGKEIFFSRSCGMKRKAFINQLKQETKSTKLSWTRVPRNLARSTGSDFRVIFSSQRVRGRDGSKVQARCFSSHKKKKKFIEDGADKESATSLKMKLRPRKKKKNLRKNKISKRTVSAADNNSDSSGRAEIDSSDSEENMKVAKYVVNENDLVDIDVKQDFVWITDILDLEDGHGQEQVALHGERISDLSRVYVPEKACSSAELPVAVSDEEAIRKSKKISEIELSEPSSSNTEAKLTVGDTSKDAILSSRDLTLELHGKVGVREDKKAGHLTSETKSQAVSRLSDVSLASKACQEHIEELKLESAESDQNNKRPILRTPEELELVGGLSDVNEEEKIDFLLAKSKCSAELITPIPSEEVKEAADQVSDFKESKIVVSVSQKQKKARRRDGITATSPTGTSSTDFENGLKGTQSEKATMRKKIGWKRPRLQINDDDLLIAAVIKSRDFHSNGKKPTSGSGRSLPKSYRKKKIRKGTCKLILRTSEKCDSSSKDDNNFFVGARSVLSWLIDSGVVRLNDTIQYRKLKKNITVKDGWVTRDGVICRCCSEIYSVSNFRLHAGHRLSKPCLNLFLSSNRPYSLCQLQAWSAEYKLRKGGNQVIETEGLDQNDDTCGLCGDGGELICCDSCPSTFHRDCLPTQDLPEGNWYCKNCTCDICGDTVFSEEFKSSLILKCLQCQIKYHGSCRKDHNESNEHTNSDSWFCSKTCEKVYMGFRSSVGVSNPIDDGFLWTVLRCSHGDLKVQSAQKIAVMAECHIKLAISLGIMEECFLPMVDPRTGVSMIPHVLYNLGSTYPRLDYDGFYTIILEKDDEVIAVAPIRVHGVKVAEMPLVATCSRYRRQGMCRRLMNIIEKLLKSFKVEMLVLSAIPSLVETWKEGFGFEAMGSEDRRQFNKVNLMLFPGTLLLKKSLLKETDNHSETCHNLASREDIPGKHVEEQTVERSITWTLTSCGTPLSACSNSISNDFHSSLAEKKTGPNVTTSSTVSLACSSEMSAGHNSERTTEDMNNGKRSYQEAFVADSLRKTDKSVLILDNHNSIKVEDRNDSLDNLHLRKLRMGELNGSWASEDDSTKCKEKNCSSASMTYPAFVNVQEK